MARRKKNVPRHPRGTNVGLRNRASPSRLVKLYQHISPAQRKMFEDIKFGGLLKIACHTIPGDFANWLIMECFQAETMELVLPGRGRISVTADSVSHILGLPNSGDEVKYELEAEAIKFISEKYKIDHGTTPRIEEICERVKNNKSANEDFLRSWLMLAVSTFLCPSTSLHISPRCYPDVVDLERVKNLNWSQFVVNQLKDAGSKINKKGSVKGCVLVLVILYADALDTPSLHIPDTTPRVAAWSRKLLDKLIKLDTKHDGSFGKLKVKQSAHSTIQESLFKLDNIYHFVASNVPGGMAAQDKRKISDAIGKMLCGMTDLLGYFVQEVGAVRMQAQDKDTCGPSLRRSKRKRSPSNEESEDEEDDEEAEDDYVQEEDEETEDDDYKDSESEEDADAEDEEDEDADAEDGEEEDEEGEEQPNMPSSRDTQGTKPSPKRCRLYNQNMDSSREALQPISEGNEEDDPVGQPERHATSINSQDDIDEADNISLIRRLRTLKQVIEPVPLEVVPTPLAKDRRTILRERLRFREPETSTDHPIDPQMRGKSVNDSSHKRSKSADDAYQKEVEAPPIERSNLLDFTPPEINIMKFVEETETTPPAEQPSNPDWFIEPGSLCCLDELDEEALMEIEANAIKKYNLKKNSQENAQDVAATTIEINTSNKNSYLRSSEQSAEDQRTTPAAAEVTAKIEPLSVNSSVTPAFKPAPMRRQRKATVLKSPYAITAPKKLFYCSMEVCQLYDTILKTHGQPSRSRDTKSDEIIIINYLAIHIFLHELANSVKPGGELLNTVAEIGIYAINPKGRAALKRIMPLRLSGYLLSGDLNRAEIKRLFKKGTNNLDHRQMVMFRVLQAIKIKDLGDVGHYFLLVLNIRNARFEVLNSMRTLEDTNLRTCCNQLMESIKHLWSEYYSESEVLIENYEIVSIDVQTQRNNHDCWFHMLMHAEHWDGCTVCNFNDKDILNIRKLLT